MLVLGGPLDREAVVHAIPVLVAIGEHVQDARLPAVTKQCGPHAAGYARHHDRFLQVERLVALCAGHRAIELREAPDTRELSAEYVEMVNGPMKPRRFVGEPPKDRRLEFVRSELSWSHTIDSHIRLTWGLTCRREAADRCRPVLERLPMQQPLQVNLHTSPDQLLRELSLPAALRIEFYE